MSLTWHKTKVTWGSWYWTWMARAGIKGGYLVEDLRGSGGHSGTWMRWEGPEGVMSSHWDDMRWLRNNYAMIFKNVGNLCNRVITMTTNLFDFVVKK